MRSDGVLIAMVDGKVAKNLKQLAISCPQWEAIAMLENFLDHLRDIASLEDLVLP